MSEAAGPSNHMSLVARAWFGNWLPGGFNSSSPMLASILLILFVFRAVLAFSTGLTGDEAYTVVIARTLSLSYFDHPPLHQWIAHASAAALGENGLARVPFFLMAVAISVPIFLLTYRLFDIRSAWWAVFAFNVTPYFVLWPDGLIIPDVSMLLALATAGWLMADIIFGVQATSERQFARWAWVGLAMGLAGLSKYSAVMAAVSLLGFLVSSPTYRFWLFRPEPYLGACIAFLIFSPVFIWNGQHGWASFTFQINRAGNGDDFEPMRMRWFLEALGAQLAVISPWVLIPFGGALTGIVRGGAASAQVRFVLWMCGVPLILFLVMPLFGGKSIPHWSDSGWLFSYPIIGAWLARQGLSKMRPWVIASGLLVGAAIIAYLGVLSFGLPGFWQPGKDPLRWSHDWCTVRKFDANASTRMEQPPLVLANTWRVGGKVGIMFGPATTVCVFAADARGFGFVCDPDRWIGQDALLVIPETELAMNLPKIRPYFEAIDPVTYYDVCSHSSTGGRVAMFTGHKLLSWPSPRPDQTVPK